MESPCSTPSSSRSHGVMATPSSVSASRLPHHLQQPSSSSAVLAGPAVHSPSVHSLRPGQVFVTVQTLTKENLVIVVNPKTRVHDVLWKCGEILEITEDKLFGLALRQPTEGIGGDQPRHEYYFLDPAQKIFKYAPKQPRFSGWNNRSTENRPLLVLYFRVRVYIDQVRLITCSRALEHYFHQLKDNFLDQWAGSHCVSEGRCWEMAALALRATKGDNPGGYFRAEQYLPMWIIDLRGLEYVRKHMPTAFEDLKEMTKKDAMTEFCLEASRPPFSLNCHLYGLRRHKMDSVDNAVLGINAKGIEMCDIGEDGERVPLRSLLWSKVTRLSFDRKKISIVGADGTKMSLYATNENKARYLLELCKAVHQTLLVFSHQTARIAPQAQPFLEKSVDRSSTSSAATTVADDNDSIVHDAMSSCDRGQGSVNSKHRIRVKIDSNLELKIEKMELECIKQERAASQSSKTSDSTDRLGHTEEDSISTPIESCTASLPPSHDAGNRPSSVDSASQTVESGSRQVDFNFNNKLDHSDQSLFDGFQAALPFDNINYMQDLQYASSGGSRSDSVQQSNEMIPDVMINCYHQEQISGLSEDDPDTTLRTNNMPTASLSLSDLRSAGFKEPPRYAEDFPDVLNIQRANSPNGKPRWTTVGGGPLPSRPSNNLTSGQARSEPKIDSDLWAPSNHMAILNSPGPSNGRLFTKRGNSGANRMAPSINRVHSMPAHYHIVNGYLRNSPNEDYTPSLQHAQSMNAPRPKARDPPSYERAVGTPLATLNMMPPNAIAGPSTSGPLTGETSVGQASFPPASATPAQFNNESEYFFESGVLTAEKFPLMHMLVRESSKNMLSHQRRPSSCNDLTSDFINSMPNQPAFFNTGTHRGDYYFDSTAPFSAPYPINRVQSHTQRTSPSSAVVLPPPPPYPNRKALVM